MIQSKYILDILDLTFDEFESEDLLRKQIPFLTEKEREHTGVGLHIYFLGDKEIETFKIPTDKALNFDIERNPTEMLNGVEVKNEKLKVLADATVHLTNGLIDCIEIWNKNGEEYPLEELTDYELTQSWLDNSKRRTLKR
jgi:hypothetical protein